MLSPLQNTMLVRAFDNHHREPHTAQSPGTEVDRDAILELDGYPWVQGGVASPMTITTPRALDMPNTPLSALQQLILALAVFHRINPYRDEGKHPDVYAYEVLAMRWGFHSKEGHTRPLWPLWEQRTQTRPQLPKARLGARYQSARVAVSKALRRLEARGLIRRGLYGGADHRQHLGMTLTLAGIPVANQAYASFRPQWEARYHLLKPRG